MGLFDRASRRRQLCNAVQKGTAARTLSLLAIRFRSRLWGHGLSRPPRIAGSPSSWQTATCVVALLALNVYIAMRAFVCEYIPHMGSIEAAYIGLARYILNHPFELTWFPLWYTGVPYENTYPPLLHLCVAAVAWLGDVSPARAHHIVGGAVYCLGPVTLFWLALRLSGSRVESFVAGLLYSLISPSALLINSVAEDVGSIWAPRRLQTLGVYGEAPHLAAMALLPLAVLALDFALTHRRPLPTFAAAFALASVVLSNWLGAFALAVAVLVLLLARSDSRLRAWLHAAGIGALAYALASPWIPPGNLGDIRRNAQHVVGDYPLGAEQLTYAVALVACLLGSAWVLRRGRIAPEIRFSVLFSLAIGVIPLMAVWTGRYMMPQPERYHLEMEMGCALVAAFGAGALLRRAPRTVAVIVVGSFLVFAVRQTLFYRHYARGMLQPFDITTTVEYEAAEWLGENLPGKRVFATGSVQFWLNAFADNPQLGGGFGQGIVNRQIPIVHSGIPFTAGDGQRTAMWLRVYGVQAVVVSGPGSRDAYPDDWKDPRKFDGVLRELWRSGHDAIYAVPQRSSGLAYTIRAEHLVRRAPVSVEDVASVEAYAAALEERSLPDIEADWTGPDRATLRARLEPDHLISVQVACHEGWSARVGDRAVEIECDALGFQVLRPLCEGECEVELTYNGGLPAKLMRAISGAAMLAGAVWFTLDYRRRRITAMASPSK